MNEANTPVEVINYQGSPSALSGYTLPITPFTFRATFNLATVPGIGGFDYIGTQGDPPDYLATENTPGQFPLFLLTTEIVNTQYISDKRIVWDFGDGTFSTDLTGVHYYKSPGIYTINTFVFDFSGGVYKNTSVPSVTCYNFIEDTFNVSVSTAYLSSNQYILTAGRIQNPFDVYTQSSWQTPGEGTEYTTTIGLRLLSGTSNFFTQKLDTNKYGHLYPYSSFYDIDNDGNFVEIEDLPITRTPIYCALSATTPPSLYITTSDNLSSVVCGVSGIKPVYVKDDISGYREITVFDKSFNYNNTIPIIMACEFVNDTFTELAISSNGITGEGSVNNTFEIDPIKYVGQKINFIITLKDSDYFTVKNSSNLILSSTSIYPYVSVTAVNSNGVVINSLSAFNSNFTTLSSITGGFFKGTFIPTITAENISIVATTTKDSQTFSVSSNQFNVYPAIGKNRIAKVNEDFDFSGTLNSLRYQEFLIDKTVLFDDFLGTAFGDATAEPTSPGKLAYEKIANFTSNTGDVYKSNIDGLLSMNSMIGGKLDVYDTTSFSPTSELKRLVDIVSINHSRLWGSRNQFNENFNNVLGADSEIYGLNLGNKLDLLTTILTSGNDGYVVALEKFSNKYTKYSTFISLISTTAINPALSTYALSSYNDTWGWNLLLTPDVTGDKISTYYDFYEFVPTPENTHYNNVINFNDPYTTIQYTNSSYNDWVKKGGIVEEMIDYILYTGTGVLSS